MNRLQYFKLFILALILGSFSNTTFAQDDPISLGEHNGFEISYTIQFLGSIDKKNASKSRDEYQLTTIVVNKNPTTMYGRNATVAGVKVGNAKSLTKTSRLLAPRSRYMTADSAQLYMFKSGETLRNGVKIKVPKGQKPVVVYESPTSIFQTVDKFQIMVTDVIVNGTWRGENSTQAIALTFNPVDNTIRQQGTNGVQIIWYKIAPRTFQRVLQGATPNLGSPNPDNSQSYSAKIVFLGAEKIIYTNSEGITLHWMKN